MSTGEGDALFNLVAQGDLQAVATVAGYRAEGATDEDIRWWWNLPRAERVAVLQDDERTRMAHFSFLTRENGLDGDHAAQRVFQFHPRFGDPGDTTHASGEDRPLPIVLKDRVNQYVESRMGDADAFKKELEASTSFNALLRAKLGWSPGIPSEGAKGAPLESDSAGCGSRAFLSQTLERLREASAKCNIFDLIKLFDLDASSVVKVADFDPAMRLAINQQTHHQAAIVQGDDGVRREIRSEIVSGYLVGRRLFGTHKRDLTYSRPDEIAGNAASLTAGLDTFLPSKVYEYAGVALEFFELRANYQSELGQFGQIKNRDLAVLFMVTCLFAGLFLALAETELALSSESEI